MRENPYKEQLIFHGTPSHWINFNAYVKAVLITLFAMSAPKIWDNVIALVLPDAFKSWRDYYMWGAVALFFVMPIYAFSLWLRTYFHRYTVTSERFSEARGVFTRHTEELELYRIKDISLYEPFSLRVFGCSNIILTTSDRNSPVSVIFGVRNGRQLLDDVRHNVEIMRARKGVREID
ncbi:MAG: PH domain-containing protein [Rickettsiales bacterium]